MNNSLSQQAAVLALKRKAHQFRNEAGNQSIREYLVRWVWEHSIRNRIHCNYVQLLCALMERLLVRLGNSAAEHPCAASGGVRRLCPAPPVRTLCDGHRQHRGDLLMKIGRDVELLTGVNAGAGLDQEQKIHLKCCPFPLRSWKRFWRRDQPGVNWASNGRRSSG